MKALITICTAFLLLGCIQNPYSQYYIDQTEGRDVTTLDFLILSDESQKAIFFTGGDINCLSFECIDVGQC
jgi:hypothetical protein